MSERSCPYARYSDPKQNPKSVDDQLSELEEFRIAMGWSSGRVYVDRAISGAAAVLRPGYQKLLFAIRNREMTVLTAESLDRLSRDMADAALLYKLCKFNGVRIVTIEEGEINEIHVGIKGTMSALYLTQLASKTKRGLKSRVKEGSSAGGVSYGYDVVFSETDRGQRRENLTQADVVRRIYTMYAADHSPRDIAFTLNAEGIPGPRGGAWTQSTINGNRKRGTGILNNELYQGELVWNRLTYAKDPDTGKRRSKLNAEDVVLRVPVPQLRLVDDALVAAVRQRQAKLDARTQSETLDGPQAFWAAKRPTYLFSGLIRCGACGNGCAMISATHLGCSTARNKGPTACANTRTIKRTTLEGHVLNALKTRLMDPQVFASFVAGFTAEWNKAQGALASGQDTKRGELARTITSIARIVAAVEGGAFAEPFNARLLELDTQRKALEKDLARAEAPAPRLMPNLAEVYRAKVVVLQEFLESPDSGGVRDAIRALVDEIRLIPDELEPKAPLSIEVRGDLAAILAFASGTKAEAANSLATQLKLVAGAGFEPAAFRL